MTKELRLKNFPISFFSVILGLAGFTIAWQKIENTLLSSAILSNSLLFFTGAIFFIISVVYLLKIMFFFGEVKKEFRNPIKLSFFPTFSISFLLLSIAMFEVSVDVSKYLWIFGLVLHFIFTIKILSNWFFKDNFRLEHFNPAWFIPVVGNILVPVVGVHHFNIELSWFFFSIGLLFWLILLIIVLYRIIFYTPLLNKMLPTFFILIAPPAIGFIAYVKLTGEVDSFARVLYYFALFLVILLLANVKRFFAIEFYLSWWAYSFPLASISIASFLMFSKTGINLFINLSLIFLCLVTLLITFLFIRTTRAIMDKKICIIED